MGCNHWPGSYSLGRTNEGKPDQFSPVVKEIGNNKEKLAS